ncbi:hypothetical protein [Jannaschia seohaensis]|uniref:Tetratricopeptide repeat protein n=1 Tax=Jannaschia seohaensis TaxID=475081 RepID=A0A2Y9B053_9RHOB|nr:hypothetical protein [Jannaschia seohaensis]PWJ15798.1 hypothetical protein BCF38_11018 [Jannaschia seohaensis]SSA49485.1 hypothetical protein SAMN05421539_11018 [Jannaschia seohaensis]
MKAGRVTGAVGAALLLIATASCTPTEGRLAEGAFQAQYMSARTALETGDYDRAETLYRRLMPKAGPLGDRIRLEYSHTVLRAGDFAAAADMADRVASDTTGDARAAALAVRGTAHHEMALAILGAGDPAAGAARLTEARAALREVLRDHPEMDPLGSLAGRVAAIDARLAAME